MFGQRTNVSDKEEVHFEVSLEGDSEELLQQSLR